MAHEESYKLSPGRQPYDPINGMRVGTLVGAILGAIVAGLTDLGFWTVIVLAVIGGAAGYWSQKRKLHN